MPLDMQESVRAVMEKAKVDYSHTDMIYDGAFGRSIRRWTMLLPGSGCSWARKKHKGCSFCAFNDRIDEVTGGRLIPRDEMMDLYFAAEAGANATSPELVALFNGGNFINDAEITAESQMALLKAVADHPTLKTVLFESKTEYLSTRKLEACLRAVGSKKIRVAIGLECKDDDLRNKVINKGMSKDAYERAIRRLHAMGIEVHSYVFMKPLTVTEDRAIQEGIDSIQYAVDCGSDVVMLEAAMVQKGTAFEGPYLRGEFDSPWLWSIRAVVERTRHLKAMNVGIFDEEPKPLSYPRNCPLCTDRFNQAFRVFRETNDFAPLASLECACRKDWENAVSSGKLSRV